MTTTEEILKLTDKSFDTDVEHYNFIWSIVIALAKSNEALVEILLKIVEGYDRRAYQTESGAKDLRVAIEEARQVLASQQDTQK